LRNAAILALEAEDHYVRVHTPQGSELILIRLADAIAEMGQVDGARTHRSWWVARAAVTAARKAEGRATLTLSNGAEAPVSRNALSELTAKGWL
jgi:DNA-binding LytR/AlgR family response regulator